MAESISFLLATTLVLLCALASQNVAAQRFSAHQRPAIKPSRTSAYITRTSNENQNKLRQKIAPAVGYPIPTVTRTTYDLQTVTIIKTTVSTVVETTIIDALRDTSVYVGVPVEVTARAETITVLVRDVCPTRVFPDVVAQVEHDALKPEIEELVTKMPEVEELVTKMPEVEELVTKEPEKEILVIKEPEIEEQTTEEQGSVEPITEEPVFEVPVTEESIDEEPETESPPQDDSVESLLGYLNDFNSMMGNLEVPKNRRKVMLNFIKYTSEQSLKRTTKVQKRIIKEQLQSLCQQGKLAENDPESFFLQLAGFVAYMKNSIRRVDDVSPYIIF